METFIVHAWQITYSVIKVSSSIKEESGGVLITFPGESKNKTGDIMLKGPKESVDVAKVLK